jgi:DNA replication and repair protein RecF
MRLTRLAAQGFRNLDPFDLRTDASVVVFHGDNAQGKTNALEAIWMLATLRPLRGHRAKDLVRWGQDEAAVAGEIVDGALHRRFRVDLGKRRKASIDDQEVRDVGEYFAGIRAIAFTPSDGAIVTHEPDLRRRWIDRAAFTLQPAHLTRVRAYSRCLSQKSAALRADRPVGALIDVLDDQLADLGARLAEAREATLDALRGPVAEHYQSIAGREVSVGLRYRTVCQGGSVSERTQTFRKALEARRSDELRRRMCLVGPQKDEVVLTLDGQAARRFGSRGQVRSLVLAMKLGELAAARERGQAPLFLLDDLSSELDRERIGRLVRDLLALDAQVLVTTTDPTPVLDAVARQDCLAVTVEDGRLASLESA